ncbi:MAG: hypothetical protein A4E53_00215 [Pelotomaculum sp. PtaB.Bin104]|nr:MAG: hypothetical protein A4E53_00215 [Pelotomaculum sp. PtaB.Bin104]
MKTNNRHYCLLCCGILRKEINAILPELTREYGKIDITYVDPGLHVDLDKLSAALAQKLAEMKQTSGKLTLVYGSKCHPDMDQLACNWDAKILEPPDCISLLAGPQRDLLDRECRTFYLSPGWLEHWERIFKTGLGWDTIDARQNMGFYDRILLLDTGVASLSDEKILEFYDYCQVPVDIFPVELDYMKQSLFKTLAT